MNSNKDISSLGLGLIRKYVTKTLLTGEKTKVDKFIEEHPDLKSSLDEMTLADLKDLEAISTNVINKLPKKKTAFPYGSVAAILIVLIGTLWYFNSQSGSNAKDGPMAEEKQEKVIPVSDSSEVKTIPVTSEVDLANKTVEVDTFYTVKKKGKNFEFDIESTNQTVAIIEESKPPVINIENKEEIEKDKLNPIVEKHFKFKTNLEYRQSVAVESDFASAHKVGNTSAYAGAIAGYEYDAEGMPFYGESDDEFYKFIESQLASDKTLEGITKKMQARVSFEVNNKGKVNDVKIINCNHKQLCMSLSDIFENIPDWYPGTIKGKKGRAHYVIEVLYSK
jgi:hypothetical protein